MVKTKVQKQSYREVGGERGVWPSVYDDHQIRDQHVPLLCVSTAD